MFDHRQYVPDIRWKAGEKRALQELFPRDKQFITPVLEILDESLGDSNDTVAEAYSVAGDIEAHWGNQPAFVDVATLQDHDRPTFVRHLVAHGLEEGINLIPVVTPRASETFLSAVKRLHGSLDVDVCLRLYQGDLSDKPGIERVLSEAKVDPDNVHLILDLKLIAGQYDSFDSVLGALPRLKQWKSLSVLGGAFPRDLTEFKLGNHLVPRTDWCAWREALRQRCIRVPSYGDYATIHPFYQRPVPGKILNVSASIRYAYRRSWLVMRGQGLLSDDSAGSAQYWAHAELLIDRPEYRGKDFSFGDRYISEVAAREAGPGNPMTWVTAGVNHHLTLAVRQLSILP